MSPVVLYGIRNCDTVRKARRWLDESGTEYRFHDFRVDGLPPAALDRWMAFAGWETLLNRRGATWRRLPEADRADIHTANARALMLAHPTLIKRPVLETGGRVLVGFNGDQYKHFLDAREET